jgi:hypothetical protein
LRGLFWENDNLPQEDHTDIVTFHTAGLNFKIADDLVEIGDKLIAEGRKFMFVVTDEIDASLRAASTQYIIALMAKELREDSAKLTIIREAVRIARDLKKTGRYISRELETGTEVKYVESESTATHVVDRVNGRIRKLREKELRARCAEAASKSKVGVGNVDDLYKWVVTALEMVETYERGAQYAMVGGEVKLIDASDGLAGDRRLSEGRHTALEA